MTGRLIDVKATIETLSKDPLFPLVEKYGLSTVLEAMPTVEAIPVEWLKQYAFGKNDNGILFNAIADYKWEQAERIEE